jgi:hypothetical protein
MSSTLGICGPDEIAYYKLDEALDLLVRATKTVRNRWYLLKDSHQISTFDASKSGCAYFGITVFSQAQAIEIMMAIYAAMPDVNCELHYNVDGAYDLGDGRTSYSVAEWEKPYTEFYPRGKSWMVRVDAMNVKKRSLARVAA